jgi:two-component system cell cycle response regulator
MNPGHDDQGRAPLAPRVGEQLMDVKTPGMAGMRALIADDDRVTTAILSAALRQCGLEVTVAHDGVAAWAALTGDRPPSLAIVDWMMPGVDGVELCRRIRSAPTLAGTYVLILTGRDTRKDLIAALDSGADDFMVKPIDAEELRARVQVGLRIATLQARLAERVSQLQVARDHLARLASTDALTELYSRRSWFDLANAEFSRSRRHNRPFSIMVADLDSFKQINDTFGHEGGDKVLQQFAGMLRMECRNSDSIGRIGGEEFALLHPETSMDAAGVIAARIIASCRRLRVSTPTGDVRCSCSIGIAERVLRDDTVESVLRRADAALYNAKRSGRDQWKRSENSA